MNASISVEKWVVDSIVGILVSSGAVDYWGSNLVVYLWKSISVVSVSINSSIIDILGFSFSITLSNMVESIDTLVIYWNATVWSIYTSISVYNWRSISFFYILISFQLIMLGFGGSN